MSTRERDERTSNRGFAAMDVQKQREIASAGGRAAHAQGTAHEFTSEEARAAGRKGGEAVSQNRQHMAEIGRKGGESSRGRVSAGSRSGNSGLDGENRSPTMHGNGADSHGDTGRQIPKEH